LDINARPEGGGELNEVRESGKDMVMSILLLILAVLGFWFVLVPMAAAVFIGAIACWPLLLCLWFGWLISKR
jgi:hypothetical protein